MYAASYYMQKMDHLLTPIFFWTETLANGNFA